MKDAGTKATTETTLGLTGKHHFTPFLNVFWSVYLRPTLPASPPDIASGARSLVEVCPRGLGAQEAADLFISFAARDTEIEKMYLLSNEAQPTHRALVSCCLFGISNTEVHPTFSFKCCQHRMSGRQIDWRLLRASFLQTCD